MDMEPEKETYLGFLGLCSDPISRHCAMDGLSTFWTMVPRTPMRCRAWTKRVSRKKSSDLLLRFLDSEVLPHFKLPSEPHREARIR